MQPIRGNPMSGLSRNLQHTHEHCLALQCSISESISLIQSSQPNVPVKQIELIQKRGLFACTTLTSTLFHSAPLPAAWYKRPLRSVNADSKERFNCIQENMHIELLITQVIFILFSSVLLNPFLFFVFLLGLWFRYSTWSSLISGNGKGFRGRSNGWRSWRWCAGEYNDFQINRGISMIICIATLFPAWNTLNTLWYHHRGSYETLTFLSVEQKP